MNAAQFADRYATLKRDIERCLSHREGWSGLPPLLDELHAVRCEYRAACEATRQAGGGDARHAGDAAGPRTLQ